MPHVEVPTPVRRPVKRHFEGAVTAAQSRKADHFDVFALSAGRNGISAERARTHEQKYACGDGEDEAVYSIDRAPFHHLLLPNSCTPHIIDRFCEHGCWYTSNVACDQVATNRIKANARSATLHDTIRVFDEFHAALKFSVGRSTRKWPFAKAAKFDVKPAYRLPSVLTMI